MQEEQECIHHLVKKCHHKHDKQHHFTMWCCVKVRNSWKRIHWTIHCWIANKRKDVVWSWSQDFKMHKKHMAWHCKSQHTTVKSQHGMRQWHIFCQDKNTSGWMVFSKGMAKKIQKQNLMDNCECTRMNQVERRSECPCHIFGWGTRVWRWN